MNLKGLADLVKEHFKLSSLPKVTAPEITEVLPKSYEEMGEIIYLDLDKTVLHTIQYSVNGYTLDSIVRGVVAGDEFPPVFVSLNVDGSYNIEIISDRFDSANYGGNHRAIAHKKAKKPLKCVKVKNENPLETSLYLHTPTISQVSIDRSSYSSYEYLRKKSIDKRYR